VPHPFSPRNHYDLRKGGFEVYKEGIEDLTTKDHLVDSWELSIR
jgi:hypothetical protein